MTKSFWRVVVGLAVVAMLGEAAAQPMDPFFQTAVMESLSSVHPRQRGRWLDERGIELPGWNAPLPPISDDSGGLRLCGKWGRGPTVEVTGRDSLVFLSLGSEVAIVDPSDPSRPQVLAEVQAMGLVTQSAVRDSFLYVGCPTGRAGIEVWNIADPTRPVFRSYTSSLLTDFCISDTFLYLTQALSGQNDTFKVYSTANPAGLRLLGTCRDSGSAVAVSNQTAFLADRWGLYAVDVSDPATPHRVGSYGGVPLSVAARGNICCVTMTNPNVPDWLGFRVLDVSDPSSIQPLASVDSAGGWDMDMVDSVVLVSGYYQGVHEFAVLSIADSLHPAVVGHCSTPGLNYAVWASRTSGSAVVADGYEGMAVLDLHDLTMPDLVCVDLGASSAEDIDLSDDVCYVANLTAGLKLLDVADPTLPRQLGQVDSISGAIACFASVASDSYAFFSWSRPYFHVADVTDPTNPQIVASCGLFVEPRDMVLRDSLIYAAENYKFEVVNVARPRQPRVVGTVNLPDYSYGLHLHDSLAYVANYPTQILSVASPTNPRVVGSIPRGSWSVYVQDSLAYLAAVGLHIWDVGNPATPVCVDSLVFGRMVYDVVVVDTLAYLACSDGLRLASVADPHHAYVIAFQPLPYQGWRLEYQPPYLYVAMRDAGVAILETASTGIHDDRLAPRRGIGLRVWPSVVRRHFNLEALALREAGAEVRLFGITGRLALSRWVQPAPNGRVVLDLSGVAPGVYLLELQSGTERRNTKVVKQ